MGWYIGAIAASLIATAGLLFAPSITTACLAAILILAIFVRHPKAAAGMTVLAVMFSSTLESATGARILGYADEGLILLALILFTGKRILDMKPLRALPGMTWLAVFIALGVISSLIRGVPLSVWPLSLLLTVKGFIFAFAVAQLDWTSRDVRRMVTPGVAVLLFVFATSAINLAMPGTWTALFARSEVGVSYRLGLPSLIGPFDHPVAYGQFMALAAAAILAYRLNVRKGLGSAMLLGASFLGALLSFRRKAIAGALAAMLAARTFTPGKRTGFALGLLAITPLALFIGWDSLTSIVRFTYNEYFLNPSEAARTLLYRDSIALAAAYVPLGAGFGRFGSFVASQQYSPEYVDLGYYAVYRMGPGAQGGYLSDTFWPAMIGESGFLGAVAFILVLVAFGKASLRLVRTSSNRYARWIGVVSAAWLLEFTIESIAAPSFNSPPLYTLLFGAIGVVTALLARAKGDSLTHVSQRAVPERQPKSRLAP